MTLELYYYRQCPFCQIVLRKIDQLQITEQILLKNTLENREHHDFHVQATGRSTVPCLYIDGEPLFESQDIMNWLDGNIQKILGA